VILTVKQLIDALSEHDPNAAVLGCYSTAYPLTSGIAAVTEVKATEGHPLGGAPLAVFVSFVDPPSGVAPRTTLASWGEAAPPAAPPPPAV
jgi:hypothetical protein